MKDFFSFLDDSNYIMDDTGIKCEVLRVSSELLSFSSISFETTLFIDKCANFTLSNCTIKHSKSYSASLVISECENVSLNHLTITECDTTGLLI